MTADGIDIATAIATWLALIANVAVIAIALRSNRAALRASVAAFEQAKKSNELTAKALRLAHQPSIHIRKVTTIKGYGAEDQSLIVQYEIENAGGNTAFETRAGTVVRFTWPTFQRG